MNCQHTLEYLLGFAMRIGIAPRLTPCCTAAIYRSTRAMRATPTSSLLIEYPTFKCCFQATVVGYCHPSSLFFALKRMSETVRKHKPDALRENPHAGPR